MKLLAELDQHVGDLNLDRARRLARPAQARSVRQMVIGRQAVVKRREHSDYREAARQRSVADRECVKVEGNVEVTQPLRAELVAGLVDPRVRRGISNLVPDGAPAGFAPIPVDQIGPRE